MSDFMPSKLEVAPVKELSRGMITTKPSTSLPSSAFLDVRNFYTTGNGLQRRNAWKLFFGLKPQFAKIPLQELEVINDIEAFFDASNTLQMLAFGSKRLYVNIDGEAFVEVPFGKLRGAPVGTANKHVIATVGATTLECGTVRSAATSGAISGDTFTDTTHDGTLGPWVIGALLTGTGVDDGLYIEEFLTGTGLNDGGTYRLNKAQGTPVSAIRIEGLDTNFALDGVLSTDIVKVWKTDGSTVELELGSLDTDAKTLIFGTSLPAGIDAGNTLQIIREFELPDGIFADYTFIPKGIVIVDGTDRGIWKYDGVCLSDMHVHGAAIDGDDVGYLLGARAVHYFNGYLLIGNTLEDYVDSTLNNRLDQRRTLRWSSVTDISEFAIADYVIFTREMSEILSITSNEECPFVFLSNAVYYGLLSDLEGLPYQYNRLETGSVSAVGMRAFCNVPGGLAFLGQKNLYIIQMGVEGTRVPTFSTIGEDVLNVMCMENFESKYARLCYSVQQSLLLVAISPTKYRLGKQFQYSLETKSWSYSDDAGLNRFTCLNSYPYFLLLRWIDLDTVPWEDLDDTTWFSMRFEDFTNKVFTVDYDGFVYFSDNASHYDEVPNETATEVTALDFPCVVETGDFDFGSPSIYKLINKLWITVADVPTREREADLMATIEVSTNRGVTWYDKGTITIEDGTFIEDIDFRATGETIRLRFTFPGPSNLFMFSEYTIRYRPFGTFAQRGV